MRLCALVLAAGASRRTGAVNKLLSLDSNGQSMIARSIATALGSQADRVIAVLGHESDAVAAALAEPLRRHGGRLQLSVATDYAEGLSASLRHGIALAAGHGVGGALVCLGDMPLVRPTTLDRLVRGLVEHPAALACVPVTGGRRGNPVLFRHALFAALLGLSGDQGARGLLRRPAPELCEMAVDDPGVLQDFDTPERLAAYARH